MENLSSVSFSFATLPGNFLFLVITPRRLKRNVFLKLLFQALQPLLRGLLQLLQTFRVRCFNFPGQPETLGEIKPRDAYDDDNQQRFAKSLKVANDSDYGATKEISRTAQNQHPGETASQ